MQDMLFQDWALIGLVCVGAATLTVYWLIPRFHSPGTGLPEILSKSDTVFLFDGQILIDATTKAQRHIQVDIAGFTWSRLYDVLVGEYPEFPRCPSEVEKQGSTRIPVAKKDGQGEIKCEWIDGITRVELLGHKKTESYPTAAVQELKTLHLVMDKAPYPMWHVDPDNNISWSNSAYQALQAKTGKNETDKSTPIFSLMLEKEAKCKKTRVSVVCAGKEQNLWFDAFVTDQDGGFLCYAVDVNAVVEAEIAKRSFVQTLAKTFADLPIGLAIFDRNRQLALFNPALKNLTSLPIEFLTARPNLLSFFDRLRDQRMMPEPKNYGGWRHQMADLVTAATDGQYQETWALPSGSVYSVSGQPHPDGAVAFTFEDITAEVTLNRRFRTDLEITQSLLDQMDDAIVVFSENGTMSLSNLAYRKLWKVDPETSFAQMTVQDAFRVWQGLCQATPVLGEVRDFVGLQENRVEWWGQVQLSNGQNLTCSAFPVSHGATMVVFSEVPSIGAAQSMSNAEYAKEL